MVNQLATNIVATFEAGIWNGSGDIFVDGAHVGWSTGNSLTLSAFHDIIFEPGSSISNGTNANPGAGNLILRADNSGTGRGP